MTKRIEPPDMETVFRIIDEIKLLSLKEMNLKITIDKQISNVYQIVKTDSKFFENGKPPAVSFIQKTYEFSGLDGELIIERKELAKTTSNLEHAKLLLQAYKNVLEIWRTESANHRNSVD